MDGLSDDAASEAPPGRRRRREERNLETTGRPAMGRKSSSVLLKRPALATTLQLLLLQNLTLCTTATSNFALSNVAFNTFQSFIKYFNDDPNFDFSSPIVNLQLECQMSTGRSFVTGQDFLAGVDKQQTSATLSLPKNPASTTWSIDLPTPMDFYSLTCRMRMRINSLAGTESRSVEDYALLVEGSKDINNPSGNIKATFRGFPEWSVSAQYTMACSDPDASGVNCDQFCSTCAASGQPVCCPDKQIDQTNCVCISTTTANPLASSTALDAACTDLPEVESKENLYFWIMIGVAIAAAILLILLIITSCYICCALKKQQNARAQAAATYNATRQPVAPPVYLHTPPRDTRHGYRPPPPLPPPHGGALGGGHGVANDTFDDDFDSLAGEWQEPNPRREARV